MPWRRNRDRRHLGLGMVLQQLLVCCRRRTLSSLHGAVSDPRFAGPGSGAGDPGFVEPALGYLARAYAPQGRSICRGRSRRPDLPATAAELRLLRDRQLHRSCHCQHRARRGCGRRRRQCRSVSCAGSRDGKLLGVPVRPGCATKLTPSPTRFSILKGPRFQPGFDELAQPSAPRGFRSADLPFLRIAPRVVSTKRKSDRACSARSFLRTCGPHRKVPRLYQSRSDARAAAGFEHGDAGNVASFRSPRGYDARVGVAHDRASRHHAGQLLRAHPHCF